MLALAACGGQSPPAPAPPPPVPSPPPVAHGTFGAPELITITGYTGTAEDAWITPDGKYLLFDDKPEPKGGPVSVPQCARMTDYKTATYVGPVTGFDGVAASMATDSAGNAYVVTPRWQTEAVTIGVGQFADCAVTGVAQIRGLPRGFNMSAAPSADGSLLVYSKNEGSGSSIAIAGKNTDGSFTEMASSITASINKTGIAYGPAISPDGLELFFNSPHMYRATRTSLTEAFGAPEVIDTGDGLSEGSSLSLDGNHLYFHKLTSQTAAELRVVTRP